MGMQWMGLVGMAALLLATSASAAPLELSHQGRLLDAAGDGVEGAHDLSFTLYSTASGGSSVWSEVQSITVQSGYYGLLLGSVTPLNSELFQGTPLYLEIAVDGAAPMPRQRLGSVPYAVSSSSSGSSSGGGVLLGFWELDEVSGTTFVDGSGGGNTLSAVSGGLASGSLGHSGKAVAFLGGVLKASTNNGIGDSPYVTVEAWVNPSSSVSGDQTIFHKEGGYQLSQEDGHVIFGVTGGAGSCRVTHVASTVVGTWSHVSGYYNGREIAVLVDDYLISSPCTVGPIAGTVGDDFFVGARDEAAGQPYLGSIDELRLWGFAPMARLGYNLSAGQQPSCDSASEGVMFYADGVFRGCDGTNWQYIGGDQTGETWRFGTCGKSGRTGPSQSQCNTAYSGSTLAGNVTVNAGIQQWTVPETGTYEITTWGSGGAEGTYNGGSHAVGRGGRGAMVSGRFELTAGTVLKVLVGQHGTKPAANAYDHQPGGGGGGTFVATLANSAMIVAGAGGGGGDPAYGQEYGGDGRVETSGESVYDHYSHFAAGGTSGGGGATYNNYVGAGAGFSGNGAAVGNVGNVSRSFLNGGAGGNATSHAVTAHGGFGGGGQGELCGGGGGGYSGGGAVCVWSSYGRSGGGGSYNTGTHQNNLPGENLGDGRVKIVFLH